MKVYGWTEINESDCQLQCRDGWIDEGGQARAGSRTWYDDGYWFATFRQAKAEMTKEIARQIATMRWALGTIRSTKKSDI